jgi:hypothetical protein
MLEICISCYNSTDDLRETLKSLTDAIRSKIVSVSVAHRVFENDMQCVKKVCLDFGVRYFSSDDKGVYQGFNRLLSEVDAEYFCFFGAGDLLNKNFQFSKLGELKGADVICNGIVFVNEDRVIVRRWDCGAVGRLNLGWMPPHTGLVLRTKFARNVGFFDENFKISGDYDYVLRCFSATSDVHFTGEILTLMKNGGISTDPSNVFKKLKEDYVVAKRHLGWPKLAVFLKRLRKLHQLTFLGIKIE